MSWCDGGGGRCDFEPQYETLEVGDLIKIFSQHRVPRDGEELGIYLGIDGPYYDEYVILAANGVVRYPCSNWNVIVLRRA